jgi:uncharacterized repeat protein (TIGR02543 family)
VECYVGAVTTATLTFTSSEEGTYHYRVLEASHTAPSAGVIKARQGGAIVGYGNAAEGSGNNVAVSRLVGRVQYNAYVVVEDAAGNLSEVLTIANVKPTMLRAVTNQPEGSPKVLGKYSDGESNFYLIDAGYVSRMFISELYRFNYTGYNVTAGVTQTTIDTVTNSLSNTVSESIEISHSDTDKWTFGAEIEGKFGIGAWGVSAKVKTEYENSWSDTTSTTNSKSRTDTVETAKSVANGISASYTFEDYDLQGMYRYALYGDCDIYFVIKTTLDNHDLKDADPESWQTVVCNRPGYTYCFEYSADGNFTNEPPIDKIEFDQDFWTTLDSPITHTLSFDTGGGTVIPPRNVSAGTPLSLTGIVAPTRAGYEFAGWTKTDGSEIPTVMPDTDLRIKAKWLALSQPRAFYVGNPRITDWYRTDWRIISLPLAELKKAEFGYTKVLFTWETTWAENAGSPDCTAHVVLDCADIYYNRASDWSYYDAIVNPGATWKTVTWTNSLTAPTIDTVIARPNVRCCYGYDKHESNSYYDLSGTVYLTVTAVK